LFEMDEFECWIRASHEMFECLEGRYDVYPLATLWVNQWLDSSIYVVQNEHIARINNLIDDFEYTVFGVYGKQAEKIDKQFRSLIKDFLRTGENIGYAIAPYLFTWNFQRFKKYFIEDNSFDLNSYFNELGRFLDSRKQEIKHFRGRKMLEEEIESGRIEKLFNDLNNKLKELGIGHNEPIGVIKILHVCSPQYFPLIDNDIAKAFRLKKNKRESLTSFHYLKWMKSVQSWLSKYDKIKIEKLETEFGRSILKLVDQALYIMCSLNLKKRVGLKVDVDEI